jgi:hypothetical protein
MDMSIITQFLDTVMKLLPLSPFIRYIDALATLPYLRYLNWFIPIPSFIVIGQAWLVAIGLYYIYSIVLRWVKAIK